ncbi:hypothetical protein [Dyella sp.]|uniref:hypothetical protein n=1 Tax=Dyella sp. TaxID=1869338 RepID=UPI002ED19DD5
MAIMGLAACHGQAFAAGGSYLVDDASITTPGRCQLESWLQAFSSGRSVLDTAPACSTGPVEWSATLAIQRVPHVNAASPGIKWQLRNGDAGDRWGIALATGATRQQGHWDNATAYAAFSRVLPRDQRWTVNFNVGLTRTPGHAMRLLTGEEAEFTVNTHITLIGEHLRPLAGKDEEQLGCRYVFGNDSFDLIAGLSGADHWMTVGLNLAF